jgi:predicted aconitase
LHRPENRRARLIIDVSGLSPELRGMDAFYPVMGTLYGRLVGESIGFIAGLEGFASEDQLKAFGAAAASAGGVGLFHVAGVTPEAPDMLTACGGEAADETIFVTPEMVAHARASLSTAIGARLDAVAIGSPHLSHAELKELHRRLEGRRLAIPLYANTGRHAMLALGEERRRELEALGVVIVRDTCVVVTPILPEIEGAVLMTNSGKFAHYAPGNTGYGVIYGSLAECVESAVAGRVVRDETPWR